MTTSTVTPFCPCTQPAGPWLDPYRQRVFPADRTFVPLIYPPSSIMPFSQLEILPLRPYWPGPYVPDARQLLTAYQLPMSYRVRLRLVDTAEPQALALALGTNGTI